MRGTTIGTGAAGTAMSRRAALARLAGIALGAASTACTPGLVTRALYPEAATFDGPQVDRVLTAFVTAVLAGAPDAERVTPLLADPALRFAPYRRALAADLTRRAAATARRMPFEQLDLDTRVRIIDTAVRGGGVGGRLCTGGIFVTQVAYYAGVWNADGACPCVGFEGPYVFRGHETLTYPHPDAWLPAATTADGNPA